MGDLLPSDAAQSDPPLSVSVLASGEEIDRFLPSFVDSAFSKCQKHGVSVPDSRDLRLLHQRSRVQGSPHWRVYSLAWATEQNPHALLGLYITDGPRVSRLTVMPGSYPERYAFVTVLLSVVEEAFVGQPPRPAPGQGESAPIQAQKHGASRLEERPDWPKKREKALKVKKMVEDGVSPQRAADLHGLSYSSYLRYLKVIETETSK